MFVIGVVVVVVVPDAEFVDEHVPVVVHVPGPDIALLVVCWPVVFSFTTLTRLPGRTWPTSCNVNDVSEFSWSTRTTP